MPARAPAVDLEVGGYRLDEAVANDDLGVVHRAHHVESRRPALVWILSPLAGDTDVVGYLERELRSVARLDNPRVLASGRVRGLPYVVTDDAGPEWIATREDVTEGSGKVHRLAAWAAAAVIVAAAGVLAGVVAVGHPRRVPANGWPAAVAPAPGGAAAGTPVPGAPGAGAQAPKAAPGAAATPAILVPDADAGGGDEGGKGDDGGGDRG